MKISQTVTELWGVQELKLYKISSKNNQRVITLKRGTESNHNYMRYVVLT